MGGKKKIRISVFEKKEIVAQRLCDLHEVHCGRQNRSPRITAVQEAEKATRPDEAKNKGSMPGLKEVPKIFRKETSLHMKESRQSKIEVTILSGGRHKTEQENEILLIFIVNKIYIIIMTSKP